MLTQIASLSRAMWKAVPVVDDGEEAEGEADTEGHGNSVLGVGGHALEDLASSDDGRHNHGETRASQHDIGRTARRIGGACKAQGRLVRHSLSNSKM